jgi:hypothetical protein
MFDNFEFNPDLVPKVKLGVHAVQVVIGVVIWCLEIAVFTGSEAKIVGNNGWTFGVVSLLPRLRKACDGPRNFRLISSPRSAS